MFSKLSAGLRSLSLAKHVWFTANRQFKLQQKYLFTQLSLQFSTIDPIGYQQEPPKRPKKPPVPKITLLTSTDDSVTVTTLEEAQHLSKRRDLKLVKIIDFDTKTQRPVYKLMTGNEYHAEELKQRELRKHEKSNTLRGEKILMMKSGISEHDLEVNIKKILKWISKKCEVRITINGNETNMEQSENVYKFVEAAVKDQSRILQKRIKGSDLKFQIIPPKDDKNKSSL